MFDPLSAADEEQLKQKCYIYLAGQSGGIFFQATIATGKVSWLGKVLAQHIPGPACQPAGRSHPATGLHKRKREASGMGSC